MALSLPRPGASTPMNASGFEGDLLWDQMADAVEAHDAALSRLKPLPTGCYDRQGGNAANAGDSLVSGDLSAPETFSGTTAPTYDHISGVWINNDWADLEPTERGNFDLSVIESDLALMQTRGISQAMIRIFGGPFIPAWMVDQSAIDVFPHFYNAEGAAAVKHWGTSSAASDAYHASTNPYGWQGTAFAGADYAASPGTSGLGNALSGAMPNWCDERFADHAHRVLARLCAVYDSEPLVRAISISFPMMTEFAEPAQKERQAEDGAGNKINHNRLSFGRAGYEWTIEREWTAWRRMFEAAAAASSVMRFTLPLNPVERYGDIASSRTADAQYTIDVMNMARKILGDQLIVANNSARQPWQTSGTADWKSNDHTFTVDVTSGSPVVTVTGNAAGFRIRPGMRLLGATLSGGSTVPSGTTIVDVDVSNSRLTLSNNVTTSGSGRTLTVANDRYSKMFSHLCDPIEQPIRGFQTIASLTNIGTIVQSCIDRGALYVELPINYNNATGALYGVTPSNVDAWNAAMEANAAAVA